MKTIYIDSDFHCHIEDGDRRIAVQTEVFDTRCNKEIECYIYMPLEGGGEYVECFDSKKADDIRIQYTEDCDNMMSLADVADIVELVYEDDLGIIG